MTQTYFSQEPFCHTLLFTFTVTMAVSSSILKAKIVTEIERNAGVNHVIFIIIIIIIIKIIKIIIIIIINNNNNNKK